MADTVDLRDPFTGGHSRRVAELGERLLRELKVFGPEAALIASAARLHDIGKIAIPDELLKKSGMLSAEEWQVMRAHPGHGADLLVRYPDFSRGTAFVLHHHEQWDGSGYPSHLKGLDISFGARVIAVLDAFDAMTNDRPYRKAMSVEQAMLVLRAGAGKQWDPTIVDAFLRVMASFGAKAPAPLSDSSMQAANAT